MVCTLSVLVLSCGAPDPGLRIAVRQPILPVLAHKEHNPVLFLELSPLDTLSELQIEAFEFSFEGSSDLGDIARATVFVGPDHDPDKGTVFGSTTEIAATTRIAGNHSLKGEDRQFWLSVELRGTPDLTHRISASLLAVHLAEGGRALPTELNNAGQQRLGIALKQAGDEGVDSYRIPGLATTNKGTLIAVYDNRYNGPVDLQADIDVGMSRSTDGGQSWEPMKVIMDMGEYGGLPQDQNGIGDPSVLVDRITNTIWVAALWLHGYPKERAWNASRPGMAPQATGQLILVNSRDDGLSWSDPNNISPMTKRPAWQLFFNGPGKGITMEDGTLVFPAQYKDADRVPHATLIHSVDRGGTWQVGNGAKSETTEAQVVEITTGTLMLNMRDDRNRPTRNDSRNGRSVATTKDMGRTWEEHPSSRRALIEPNCMGSIIAYDHPQKGRILFFSNPDSKTDRDHITIKTSFDLGMTWPRENQLELYEEGTYGYSCLTVIDDQHLGILYEGNGDLYFQKIPLKDLIDP